jgi:quercetin dioxygenase-like cupin family protein
LVLLGPWASAQNKVPTSTDGSDPSKWDRKLDGLIAATHNHKLIFESDVIRVSSVTVFAGAEEPYHLHPYYSVLVLEPSSGSTSTDRDINGKPAPAMLIARSSSPPIIIQPPQAMHSLKNSGTRDGHLIRIEFKKGIFPTKINTTWGQGQMPISTDGTDPATWKHEQDGPVGAAQNHKIIYEDDQFRVQSVTIPAGTEEPYHDHPYPSVLVVDTPNIGMDRDRTGKGTALTANGPSVIVQPPQGLHSIKNSGTASGDYILTEGFDGQGRYEFAA